MATAGDLFSEKPTSDRPVTRGTAMATFLRSAIGRASERLAATATTAKLSVVAEHVDEDNPGSEKPIGEDSTSGEGCNKEELNGGGCETASLSDVTDEPVESQGEQTDDEPTFEVHVHETAEPCGSASTLQDNTSSVKAKSWSFCDVLLRPDELGLGLNLAVRPTPSGYLHSTATSIVSVASFRRLRADDVGPAEASGKVKVGDILHCVGGERVSTLEAVAASLVRQFAADSRVKPFVLMRFLRRTAADGETTLVTTAESQPIEDLAGDLLKARPDVAMLIRELVVKNQSLEEQLLASRLKQDEQRIQLDQLHALYAKTQLDNWTATKPFARRSVVDSSPMATPRGALSSAAARLMGTNPMQYDVEFAVKAERERLTRKYEQQLVAEKKALEAKFNIRLETVRSATQKKVEMLEFAVQQLLTRPTIRRHVSDSGEVEDYPVEVSPQVIALRHQLLHTKTRNRDCVLCLLSNEIDAMKIERDVRQDECRREISKILGENAAFRSALAHSIDADNGSGNLPHSDVEENGQGLSTVPEIAEACNSDALP